MKHIRLFYWLFAFLYIGLTSCNDDKNLYTVYEAKPKTPMGIKLTNGSGLVAHVTSDTTYTVTNGVIATEFKFLSMTGMSTKVFMFEVDLTNPHITIEASTPNNKTVYARQEMTKQALYEDQTGHLVYGGINADFFNMATGQPRSILYKNGVAIKTTFESVDRVFFAITKDKTAIVGDQFTLPDVKDNIQEAAGGQYWLVRDNAATQQTNFGLEPRTCIGVSKDGKKVFMMAVDGRNAMYSNGMSFSELAKCMLAAGASDAVNLDGGGSTTFFIRNTPEFTDNRFEIRNWPSDNGGQERDVANGLIIISNQ